MNWLHAKVHAETAKGKSRKDRREGRFQMSLRSLRANPIWPKRWVIECIQKFVAGRLSLRALREKTKGFTQRPQRENHAKTAERADSRCLCEKG